MLLFNLLEAPARPQHPPRPWGWMASAFVVIALAWAFWPASVETRPLALEEKEIVISTFQRLSQEIPAQEEWADDFAQGVGSGSVRAYVVSKAPTLLREEQETLYFNEAFFRADSITQRNAIVDTLLPGVRSKNAPEIAIGKSE